MENSKNEMVNKSEQNLVLETAIELDATAVSLSNLSEKDEQVADVLISEMDIKEQDYPKIQKTVKEFVSDYAHKDLNTTDEQFLVKKFSAYPTLWKDVRDIEETAKDIVETVYAYEQNKRELDEHIKSGKRRESWLAKKIEQGAAAAGAVQTASYAQNIDSAIENANNAMMRTIHNLDGKINQGKNLDGFIAEEYHAATFNIDAAAKEKRFTAETLDSHGKNSVDIVIRDERGKIVRKYQSKYGKDAETSEAYFNDGDYRGQRKLVPEGQGREIDNANEKIEFTDVKSKRPETIESKPLSKEDAKAMQEQAQREGKIREYTWNDASKGAIAKHIGRKAALSAGIAVASQGARIVGRRIFNWATGKENQSVEDDVTEFAKNAIKSGGSAGLTVATSGALTVAARSGWLGKLLAKTPAGHLVAAATIGIENIKTLYKYATGEISGAEAVDQAGRATCSAIGGFAAGAKASVIGASIGTVLGPAGTLIGGIAGGIVGSIAGSAVGEAVFNVGKKIVSTVANGIKSFASGVAHGLKNLASGIKRLFCW